MVYRCFSVLLTLETLNYRQPLKSAIKNKTTTNWFTIYDGKAKNL